MRYGKAANQAEPSALRPSTDQSMRINVPNCEIDVKTKCLLTILLALIVNHTVADSLVEALKNSKTNLNFRLRSEDVDQSVTPSSIEAHALTLKTRFNVETARFVGFNVFLELDTVASLVDDFNSTKNGKTGHATVADPKGTEFNQAFLSYQGKTNELRIGRQRITLDNHRFVGHVAWRQNEQTYDALSLTNTGFNDLTISAIVISNVNRIFGNDSLVGDVEMSTSLLNLKYDGFGFGKVTLYAYNLDGDPAGKQVAAGKNFNTWDTATRGIRVVGSTGEFHYIAEFARQTDARDNPSSYRANYHSLEAGITIAGVTIKLGQESLGNDGSNGFFITPLATLHKFQGWNDKFLNGGKGNMQGGIEDTYLALNGSYRGFKYSGNYHNLKPEDSAVAGFSKHGYEWGLAVAKDFHGFKMAFKYSNYHADGFASDTRKYWLTVNRNFSWGS